MDEKYTILEISAVEQMCTLYKLCGYPCLMGFRV